MDAPPTTQNTQKRNGEEFPPILFGVFVFCGSHTSWFVVCALFGRFFTTDFTGFTDAPKALGAIRVIGEICGRLPLVAAGGAVSFACLREAAHGESGRSAGL
jgi:hypothetical protein